MDFDDVYRRIGEWGRKQKILCTFMFIGQGMTALHMIFMVFAGKEPSFHCSNAPKENIEKTCQRLKDSKCKNLVFTDDWVSLPQELKLICDESYKVDFSQSVFMAGILVGSPVFGVIADSIGRLKTIYITMVMMISGSLLLGYISSFQVFVALRFMVGFGMAGHGVACFVLGCELIGGNKRALFSVLYSLFFALGICSLSGLALITTSWRQLTIANAFITSLVLISYLSLPESPRWLVSQGKVEAANRVIEKIARGNGSQDPGTGYELKLPSGVPGTPEKRAVSPPPQQQGMGSLFLHWKTFKWTMILLYSWFANSAVYYGLTMASGKLSKSLHLSVVLSGLIEFPAYLFIIVMHSRMGRKTLIVSTMILGGFACACVLFTSAKDESLRTALALIGKLGISASFVGIYLHSGEVFPTVIRNAGMGICSMAARAGGVAAPAFLVVGSYYPSREFLIFGFIGFTSGILNLQLPETLNKPLPETMNDMLNLDNDNTRVVQGPNKA